MSDTKFTPGPWQWWTSNSWRRLHGAPRGNDWVLMPTVQRPDNHPDITVSDADAHLIAAAPDLYEALESAVAGYIDSECGGPAAGRWCDTGDMPSHLRDRLPRWVEVALLALAKARGETP